MFLKCKYFQRETQPTLCIFINCIQFLCYATTNYNPSELVIVWNPKSKAQIYWSTTNVTLERLFAWYWTIFWILFVKCVKVFSSGQWIHRKNIFAIWGHSFFILQSLSEQRLTVFILRPNKFDDTHLFAIVKLFLFRFLLAISDSEIC